MTRDYRSPEAAAYRKLYNSARWRALRSDQLAKQPLCERCTRDGNIAPADVVNHRRPHKGDLALFFDPTNLESTCKPHHDSTIQREENAGFSPVVDEGGWPTDPRHLANRKAASRLPAATAGHRRG